MADAAGALAAYLHRLGMDRTPPPTWETLRDLHRRHLALVPYDNLDIMLGRPHGTDPATSLARAAAGGRVGYCFHQNGALEAALTALGYRVRRRHGHVWFGEPPGGEGFLNHLVLEVTDLPTADHPAGRWWPDIGLGEGSADPLPLVAGRYGEGDLAVELTDVGEDGWTYVHHRHGSFGGMVAGPRRVGPDAVAAAHRALSTPPDGAFTRVLVTQRVEDTTVLTLRCCVLSRVGPDRREALDLTTYDDWRAALADELLLPLDDVADGELHALHTRMLEAHRAWDDAGRP